MPGTQQNTTRAKPSRWTGRNMLIGFGLFFLTIFGANAIMVYYAITTFDGVETDNAYRKGRAYNHVLEADAAQRALGWTVTLTITASDPSDNGSRPVAATVIIKNMDGEPVELDTVTLSFWRPTHQGMDVTTDMAQHTSGIYTADAELAEAGNWIARITTSAPNGTPFVQEERVLIAPAG